MRGGDTRYLKSRERSKTMGYFLNGLQYSWKYFVAFAALAALFSYIVDVSGATVPSSLQSSMFGLKVTIGSITISAVTFYHRVISDTIDLAEKAGIFKTYGEALVYHGPGFTLLFGGACFAFLSFFVESY